MSWNDENIIFLVSLPRSGSTLLQRILSNQSEIESTSESWLLLPQVYALKEGVGFSEYSHTTAARAINDFTECLPNGAEDYLGVVADGFLQSTRKANQEGRRYFLEKTPRNNLILSELAVMFPRAKYIFLWRNPAAIAASMIESFAQGNWNLYHHSIDFEKGLSNMLGSDMLNIAQRIDIRYEDLVKNPSETLEVLFTFLGLQYDPKLLEIFSNSSLKGRMGDPTGVKIYTSVSTEPLEKWVSTFSNPLRRRWLRKYIASIDVDRLQGAGYDADEILSDMDKNKTSFAHLVGDTARMLYGYLDSRFHISLIRRQWASRKKIKRYRLQ